MNDKEKQMKDIAPMVTLSEKLQQRDKFQVTYILDPLIVMGCLYY